MSPPLLRPPEDVSMAATAYLIGTFIQFGPVWLLIDLRVYSEESPTVITGPLGTPELCVLVRAEGRTFGSIAMTTFRSWSGKFWRLLGLFERYRAVRRRCFLRSFFTSTTPITTRCVEK